MKKKWAFIRMSGNADVMKARACIESEHDDFHILTVRNADEAVAMAKLLKEEGFGAIEVCGAFGPELAEKMFEATDRTVPVGYVVTPEDQQDLVMKFWRG